MEALQGIELICPIDIPDLVRVLELCQLEYAQPVLAAGMRV